MCVRLQKRVWSDLDVLSVGLFHVIKTKKPTSSDFTHAGVVWFMWGGSLPRRNCAHRGKK